MRNGLREMLFAVAAAMHAWPGRRVTEYHPPPVMEIPGARKSGRRPLVRRERLGLDPVAPKVSRRAVRMCKRLRKALEVNGHGIRRSGWRNPAGKLVLGYY